MVRVPHKKRPGRATGAATEDTIETSVAHAADCVAQARRRRAESRRLPVLDSDLRDPWHYGPPSGPRALQASRRAWLHLHDAGLLDDEGWIAGVLAEAVAS